MAKKNLKKGNDGWILWICYGFVTIITLTIIYPVLNVLAVSMSSFKAYVEARWMVFPKEFDFSAFKYVLGSPVLFRAYGNTIFITVVGTLLTLLITMLTAYPLSRPHFRGKGIYTTYIIFTMMFSGGMIPSFLLVRAIGLYDSIWALILPGVLSAFNCILMVNFFKALPLSLFDAAKIDGASENYLLARIVVPLSKPILATIALFSMVGYWNSYFGAIIYIRSRELWPLQLLLRDILISAQQASLTTGDNIAEMGLRDLPSVSVQYAMLVIVMLPIMCIYPFMQRFFAKGIILGAVKG